MTYISTSGRAQRVLNLLGALEHPVLIARMAPYGLDEAVIERGWELLRAHARSRPAPRPPGRPSAELLSALDAWENHWWPIADASLRDRHPEIHRQLFAKLGRTRGLKVIVSVGTLVERVRALEARRELQAVAACDRLRQRGLSDDVLREAESLLAALRRPEPPPAPHDPPRRTHAATSTHSASRSIDDARAHAREAEQAMWRWYREWSQISRAVIQEPHWLRYLGFGVPGRPRAAKRPPDDARSAVDVVSSDPGIG